MAWAKLLAEFLGKVAEGRTACCMSASTSISWTMEIAPGVGTTVPGGVTFREAHLVMEMLCDSGRVTSLDLVELNPFLDVARPHRRC